MKITDKDNIPKEKKVWDVSFWFDVFLYTYVLLFKGAISLEVQPQTCLCIIYI